MNSSCANFNNVMVDLETTGTQPEHAAILQIAAIKFDVETTEVKRQTFDRKLWIAPGRYWDPETMEWWSRQKPEILHSILSAAEDPVVVLQDFREWVLDDLNGPAILWAKPSHFEYPFIESYFKQHNIQNPFHFRNVVDLRSFFKGRNVYEDPDVPFVGDAHNALFDAFHQLRMLFKVL